LPISRQAALQSRQPRKIITGWPSDSLEKREAYPLFPLFVHKDGNEISVKISGSPLRDEQGNNMDAVFFLRDQREIRVMKEQLIRGPRLTTLLVF